MSLIEQAGKRLQELQRAGVEVPWKNPEAPALEEADTLMDWSQSNVPDTAAATTAPKGRLVELDMARLTAQNYLVPGSARTELADEFRTLKRPLLNNARGTANVAPVKRGNLIMVTSSVAGEGKTFCSINLALSIATELDSRVLLVDADPQRPALLQRLGVQADRGLLDVLTEPNLKLHQVMLRTNIEKLRLLPVGASTQNATEVFASTHMQRLLDELSSRYPDRIIIFDGPPLLPSTEARELARQMGQIVMVVEAGRTTQNRVAQAFALLESSPVVLTVLNKNPHASTQYGYGGYGY